MKNQVLESMGTMSNKEFKEFLEQKKFRGQMQAKKWLAVVDTFPKSKVFA